MAFPIIFPCSLLFFLQSVAMGAVIPAHLSQKIEDAARRSALDPKLVAAIIKVESSFKSKVTSPAGAMGLMQVMPSTAAAKNIPAPYHTLNNLMGACEYLRELLNRFRGNLKLTLAAYNAGPQNVDKYGGIPPFEETRKYVKQVLAYYKQQTQK